MDDTKRYEVKLQKKIGLYWLLDFGGNIKISKLAVYSNTRLSKPSVVSSCLFLEVKRRFMAICPKEYNSYIKHKFLSSIIIFNLQ